MLFSSRISPFFSHLCSSLSRSKVCGRHFCYMCGQDWAPHRDQPGGFDYYACRLPTADGQTSAVSAVAPAGASEKDRKLLKLERECLPGWSANERSSERLKQLFRALLFLAEEFNLGISMEEPRAGDGGSSYFSAVSKESQAGRQSAWEALLACIKAWNFQEKRGKINLSFPILQPTPRLSSKYMMLTNKGKTCEHIQCVYFFFFMIFELQA